MKNFLKLAGMIVVVGGFMLNAEGMMPGEIRGRHDGVTNDRTACAFISGNGRITINHRNSDSSGRYTIDIVTSPDNPYLTINNLASVTVLSTLSKNSDRSPTEQLSGGQLVAVCTNVLVDQFNAVQQEFINKLGPNEVTLLEGTDLQVAALLAVDRVFSCRQGQIQAQQIRAYANSYEDNRRRRIQSKRNNKEKH